MCLGRTHRNFETRTFAFLNHFTNSESENANREFHFRCVGYATWLQAASSHWKFHSPERKLCDLIVPFTHPHTHTQTQTQSITSYPSPSHPSHLIHYTPSHLITGHPPPNRSGPRRGAPRSPSRPPQPHRAGGRGGLHPWPGTAARVGAGRLVTHQRRHHHPNPSRPRCLARWLRLSIRAQLRFPVGHA